MSEAREYSNKLPKCLRIRCQSYISLLGGAIGSLITGNPYLIGIGSIVALINEFSRDFPKLFRLERIIKHKESLDYTPGSNVRDILEKRFGEKENEL